MPLTNNSDDECDFNDISETNIRQIQQKAEKTGYVDGLTDGKESTFQISFDKGYADGLLTGLELQKYKAFYEHVGEKIENADLVEEKSKFTNMQLPATESQDHFQYTKQGDKCDDIESISKKQHDYVNGLTYMFKAKLPITNNLFNTT